MKTKFGLLVGAALVLAGCSGNWATSYDAPVAAATSNAWSLRAVEVTVPPTLSVSERNLFAPDAHIVWHGDVPGDRRAQVRAILDAGITQGASRMRGGQPVVMQATLQEFHAVTPRAVANAPGAVHNITYTLQVVDARTGLVVAGPDVVQADLPAFVGEAAQAAAAQGQTQKARITAHIAAVTRGWLGLGPDPRTSFSGPGR